MSALGQKQTLQRTNRCPVSANSGRGDVKRAFENALSAEKSLVTRPHYLSGATVVFEEPSGAGCIPGGDWPCGLSGVHHQCLSRSGLSSLAAASGLSFPASGYGQCCIRICLYLNPPPALKSQNWRYRLGRSRCMQNAFVALARYRDNMERPRVAKGYRQDDVRFAPESRHSALQMECPLSANSGHPYNTGFEPAKHTPRNYPNSKRQKAGQNTSTFCQRGKPCQDWKRSKEL